MSGSRKIEGLLDAEGEYAQTLELPVGGCYIGFTGDNLTGKLDMQLTRCSNATQDEG